MTSRELIEQFVSAYSTADEYILRKLLANDLKFYATNSDAGVDLRQGVDSFLENLRRIGVAEVKPAMHITQFITLGSFQVMFMVEVKAKRKVKSLHNFAAFLVEILDAKIISVHMVEALPESSAEFWND